MLCHCHPVLRCAEPCWPVVPATKLPPNHAAVGKATPATRGTATDSAVSASSEAPPRFEPLPPMAPPALPWYRPSHDACFDESSATVLAALPPEPRAPSPDAPAAPASPPAARPEYNLHTANSHLRPRHPRRIRFPLLLRLRMCRRSSAYSRSFHRAHCWRPVDPMPDADFSFHGAYGAGKPPE